MPRAERFMPSIQPARSAIQSACSSATSINGRLQVNLGD